MSADSELNIKLENLEIGDPKVEDPKAEEGEGAEGHKGGEEGHEEGGETYSLFQYDNRCYVLCGTVELPLFLRDGLKLRWTGTFHPEFASADVLPVWRKENDFILVQGQRYEGTIYGLALDGQRVLYFVDVANHVFFRQKVLFNFLNRNGPYIQMLCSRDFNLPPDSALQRNGSWNRDTKEIEANADYINYVEQLTNNCNFVDNPAISIQYHATDLAGKKFVPTVQLPGLENTE
mmetsp:Transcript_11672/g.17690  ORF Transcript_11672/g.17690 Transcript_11672/m.17690 type:complete len:234 (-) Transcript_11672:88-789(-)|eukprot:CAMPEP_0201520522 /NCGR_PEP_ID=MMETSP0161_2-20130828/11669_1 /ASSEMBLY_ACC=CAM_ASM_000251 /TAXON_ID=180227 /ORGANISM="Neoparamoeba aestuarina, Strain SoJaBio B1-5/56/2" /LENGTH=233 /DNA_ID=CAMNT_0047918917 /DNA_START=51 /DNA_END=752 /DNA_ORIENTATION=+